MHANSTTEPSHRFLRALLRLPVDTTPVWIMRQAGRYLPEYRELRAKAGSFLNLCKNPEWACEVTLQPLARFDLDAAIIFSDILTVPDAMGLGLYFAEGEGPCFERPVRSASDVNNLPVPDPAESLLYVTDAISLTRRELNNKVPLIGFAGSPWTVATYVVEGGKSRDFSLIKGLMEEDPNTLHGLLSKLAQATTDYLNAQIEAGAQAVQIFDTWGGALNTEQYKAYSLHYVEQILAGLKRTHEGQTIPVILFTKNGAQWLPIMAGTGVNALGVDWTITLADARKQVADGVALQGNLNPDILFETPAVIRQSVRSVIDSYGAGPGHVFNLGHGINKDVNPEHVTVLVDAVHQVGRGRAV